MASSIFISPALGITNTGAGISFASQILAVDGTLAAPAYAFASGPTTGIKREAADAFGGVFVGNMSIVGGWYPNAQVGLWIDSTLPLSWRTGGAGTSDAGISRLGAASLALGNGLAADFTGTLKLGTVNAVTAYQANGTPGVTTFGPSAVASITVKNGLITAIS